MSGNSERGRAAHASPGLWPTPMTGISPGGDRKGRRDSGGSADRNPNAPSSGGGGGGGRARRGSSSIDVGIYGGLIVSEGGGMTGVGTGIGSPIGDDNSVLPLPSHSVVNHLATSAIRNGVLAVATTTRYKAKVGHYRGNGHDDAEHGFYSTYPPSITDPHIPKTPPKNQKA